MIRRKMPQKSFVKKSSLLSEDMYSHNRSRLAKVDELFDKVLSAVNVEDWRSSDRVVMQKNLDKITVLVNKIFNIDMNLSLDVKATKPKSVAYTTYTEDVINVFESQVQEIIIDQKFGYSFIELKKVDVAFELVALQKFLKIGTITSKDGQSFKFEGRHMTSILLHEIGHNVFIPFYFDQDNDKNYRVKIGNAKPIIIYKDFLEYKEISTMKKLIATILYVTGMVSVIASAGMSSVLFAAASLLGGAAALGTSRVILSKDKSYAKEYMRNERNANTLPFQYGYVREILEETIFIQRLIVMDASFKGTYTQYKKLDNKYWSNGGYQSIITKDIIGMIDTEISNPNTSDKDRKLLKEVKENYRRRIKLLQAEIEIEGAEV